MDPSREQEAIDVSQNGHSMCAYQPVLIYIPKFAFHFNFHPPITPAPHNKKESIENLQVAIDQFTEHQQQQEQL